MMGMMSKLKDARKKMEETKKRWETAQVMGECQGVNVIMTVNRNVLDVTIPEGIDQEELGELMVVAFNNALEKSSKIQEEELKDVMPDVPGLGNLL